MSFLNSQRRLVHSVLGLFLPASWLTHFNTLASKERVERQKLDQEREKELLKQLKIKEERIDALHKRIEEMSVETASSRKKPRAT